jgi:hypothetical protein
MGSLRGTWYRPIRVREARTGAGGPYAGLSLELGGVWDHGEGLSRSDLVSGAAAFLGADTLLGPVMAGVGYSEEGERGFFLTLGRPIWR